MQEQFYSSYPVFQGDGGNDYQTRTPVATPNEDPIGLSYPSTGMAEERSVSKPELSLVQGDELPVVGTSSNILLLYQLSDLRLLYWVTMLLSIFCLAYIGIQLTLLAFSCDWDYVLTIHAPYHLAEFWSTFAYSVVDVTILLVAVKGANQFYYKPLVLKVLPAASLILTLVPAMLMSFDMKRYGFQAHNIEYTALVCLTLVDAILWVMAMLKSGTTKTNLIMFSLVILAMLSAVIQLIIWNTLKTNTGRQVTHIMEFCFNIIDASTTFWFITDTRLQFGALIRYLLESDLESVKSQ